MRLLQVHRDWPARQPVPQPLGQLACGSQGVTNAQQQQAYQLVWVVLVRHGVLGANVL